MTKKYLTPLLLLGFIPFLSSCASQQDVDTLNYHVRSLNKKIEALKGDPTVNQMQKRQANSSGLIDQLQADILQLKGQLEENGHMNRMLQEQNKELEQAVLALQTKQEKELNTKLDELNTKISMQEQSLSAIRQARIDDAQRRSKAAALAAEEAMRKANAASAAQKSVSRPASTPHIRISAKKIVHSGAYKSSSAKVTNPVAKPAATKPVAKPAKPQVSVDKTTAPTVTTPAASGDYFSQGEEQFARKQYKKAYTLFEKHTDSVSAKAAISARFMMGECLFKQGQFDQAIIQYQQIISAYPGNPQAAKALLKQGEAFEQLSDRDTAKIIYKKITTSYASSPEAAIAKERISSL
jgi:TolA-binding protein